MVTGVQQLSVAIISQRFEFSWIEARVLMRFVGVMNPIRILYGLFNIQGRKQYLCQTENFKISKKEKIKLTLACI